MAASIKLALVVPGSGLVKQQAEQEGLDRIYGGRLRMARAGLFDVPGDERRSARAGRTLRFDLKPKFRRAAGAGRTDPSGQSGDGGGGGDRRAFRRCARALSVD